MCTVVDAQTAVLTFYKIRFGATASNVIQQNLSSTGTVAATDKPSNVSVDSNQPRIISIDTLTEMYLAVG